MVGTRRERLSVLGEAMLAAYGRLAADEQALLASASRVARALADVRAAVSAGEPVDLAPVDAALAEARQAGMLRVRS